MKLLILSNTCFQLKCDMLILYHVQEIMLVAEFMYTLDILKMFWSVKIII